MILDLRGYDEPIETLMDSIKETMTELGASVQSIENLGVKEFAQTPDKRFTNGHYLKARIEAPTDFNERFKEKMRLDRRIHRIFLENRSR